jgi:hypothetical protein
LPQEASIAEHQVFSGVFMTCLCRHLTELQVSSGVVEKSGKKGLSKIDG